MNTVEKSLEVVEASLAVPSNKLSRYNIIVNNNRTSVTLEPRTWGILKEICKHENMHVNELCQLISSRRGETSSMSSAIRVFLIAYLDARLKYKDR